jgi:hypothetical protein
MSSNDNLSIKTIVNNDYVTAILGLIILLYASKSQVRFSHEFIQIFNNSIFKFIFLSIMAYVLGKVKLHVAIIMAFIFVFTLYLINQMTTKEEFISPSPPKAQEFISPSPSKAQEVISNFLNNYLASPLKLAQPKPVDTASKNTLTNIMDKITGN